MIHIQLFSGRSAVLDPSRQLVLLQAGDRAAALSFATALELAEAISLGLSAYELGLICEGVREYGRATS